MRKSVTLLAGLLTAASLSACGSAGGSAEPAVVVEVKNMAYNPESVTIEKGQTVEWRFDDGGLPHDVVGEGPRGGAEE